MLMPRSACVMNVNHRRAHPLGRVNHGAGIGVEQRIVIEHR